MSSIPYGKHDRRGFDSAIKLHVVLGGLSLLLWILYDWRVGSILSVYAWSVFYVLQRVSSPPVNSPENYDIWRQYLQRSHRPVLLCLGDSLTHGTVSANFSKRIPVKLATVLSMPLPPKQDEYFMDPIWVVNAGQNMITSHTVCQERVRPALRCNPHYVVLMIGTNDVRAMYKRSWANQSMSVNKLPRKPTMQQLERNIRTILEQIRQASPLVKVAVCTLPPLGEDLNTPANHLIRQANVLIEKVVMDFSDDKIHLIPIYARMEGILEKSHGEGSSIDDAVRWGILGATLRYLTPLFTFDRLSLLLGNTLLWDGLHLNERAGELLTDAIVEWLVKVNVVKVIVLKQ